MVCYRFDCYCILPCFATLLYIHFGFPLPDHKGHTMKAQNNIRHTGISTQNNIRHTVQELVPKITYDIQELVPKICFLILAFSSARMQPGRVLLLLPVLCLNFVGIQSQVLQRRHFKTSLLSSPPACSLPELCWDPVPGITKTIL